jgi:hypothetical protein
MSQFLVYRRKDMVFLRSFETRPDAVWWCGINQISSLPDGEWEDDYYLLDKEKPQWEEDKELIRKAQ